MASFWSFLATSSMVLFLAYFSTLALSQQVHVRVSTISAAPAFLPDSASPLSSPPSLSPDIEPLFPTPKAAAPSPADDSLPTIPSSPSPPNPDATLPAPGPDAFAMSPTGVLSDSSSVALHVNLAIFHELLLLLPFWLLQL